MIHGSSEMPSCGLWQRLEKFWSASLYLVNERTGKMPIPQELNLEV